MFGSLLGLLNRLGGFLLEFVIGENALKDTPRAKEVRVNTASILIGAIVGLLVSLGVSGDLYGLVIGLIMGVLIGLAVAYSLNWIDDQFS